MHHKEKQSQLINSSSAGETLVGLERRMWRIGEGRAGVIVTAITGFKKCTHSLTHFTDAAAAAATTPPRASLTPFPSTMDEKEGAGAGPRKEGTE